MSLRNVYMCCAVQKLDLSADVQKKYPHYNLYFYGEGSVNVINIGTIVVVVDRIYC